MTKGLPSPLRILIAEDNPGVRLAMATMVSLQPGLELVGEAQDGDEAFDLFEAHHPDVVITDLEMPGRNGLMLAREIIEQRPATRIVLVTAALSPTIEDEAAQLGVECLSKDDEARERLSRLLASFAGEAL